MPLDIHDYRAAISAINTDEGPDGVHTIVVKVNGGISTGGGGSVDVSSLATESTLQALKNAILAQIEIASTLWTDDSGAFYVRRDTVSESDGHITVSFFTPQGAAATPGSGLRPASGLKDYEISSTPYTATATGTGYSINDSLIHALVLDVSTTPPVVTASVWMNITTGLLVSPAPAGANVAYQAPLPNGASTAARQDAEKVVLDNILTALGGQATAAKQDTAKAVFDAILSKLSADPSTATLQTTGNTVLSAIQTALGSQATAAKQDAAKTVFDNILAKISADPATATLQGTANTVLSAIQTALGSQATAAKQDAAKAVLDNLLSKLSADPSTATLQTTGNTVLTAIQTALGNQATATKQDIAKSVLDSILAKLTSDPATATLQTSANTLLGQIKAAIEANGTGGGGGGAAVPTGTAGTPNASVLTVQGIRGGNIVKVGPGSGRCYGDRALFYDAVAVVADPGEFFAMETFLGGGTLWTTETGNCIRVVNGSFALRGSHAENIIVAWMSRYNANNVIGANPDPIVRGSALADVGAGILADVNSVMVLEPTAQMGGYTLYQFETPFNWFTWDVVSGQGRGSILLAAQDSQMVFPADQVASAALIYAINFETLAAPSI